MAGDLSAQSQSFAGDRHSGSPFDYRKLLQLALKYWYWFILSGSLALFGTYLYHRYTVPVYKSSTTLLLKNSSEKSLAQLELTEGFGLSPEMKSIENQSFIIRSQKIVKRAIERLDFGVSYFVRGTLKDTELYGNLPFRVLPDTSHVQLVDQTFEISYAGDGKWSVRLSSDEGWLYHYGRDAFMGSSKAVQFSGEIAEGALLEHPCYAFQIKSSGTPVEQDGRTYLVRFRTVGSLVSEYRNSLSVSQYSEGSSIVFVSVVGTQTGKMSAFLSMLSEVILEYNLEKKNEIATRSLTFIQLQLGQVSDSLQKVQEDLVLFRKSNLFTGPSEYSQKLSGDYFELEKSLRLQELRRDYLVYLQSNLHDQAVLEDYFVLASDQQLNPLIGQLIQQLIVLHDELNLLRSGSRNTNPYLVSLEAKQKQATQNLRSLLGQSVQQIQLQMNDSKRLLGELHVRMVDLPELERSFLDIERNYKLNDAVYTFLLQKQSENQIAKASNTPDNEVLEEPSVVAVEAPLIRKNYTRSLMGGLLLPLAILFLLELLNQKIRSVDELKSLLPNVPLVGIIPRHADANPHVLVNLPGSAVSEAFRRLRVKLNFLLAGEAKKVVLISSTDTGEGKTFTSINLAAVFAVAGKKTVLLGMDLRKPKLEDLFELKRQSGISNYLAGQVPLDDIIQSTRQANLYVVPSGTVPPNPAELISQPLTATLIEQLKARFDIVLIDSGPIGLVPETRILVDYADAFLFITRAYYTRKDHLFPTIESLLSEQVHSIGLILNDTEQPIRSYGYYGDAYLSRKNS